MIALSKKIYNVVAIPMQQQRTLLMCNYTVVTSCLKKYLQNHLTTLNQTPEATSLHNDTGFVSTA